MNFDAFAVAIDAIAAAVDTIAVNDTIAAIAIAVVVMNRIVHYL